MAVARPRSGIDFSSGSALDLRWLKNPLPIGQSTRSTAAGVSSVSETDGKRYSRGRIKLGAIAPPQCARVSPTLLPSGCARCRGS